MPFIFLDHYASSFSKDISAEYRILRWSFFFFLQQLKNIVPLFLASVVSDEKYVV